MGRKRYSVSRAIRHELKRRRRQSESSKRPAKPIARAGLLARLWRKLGLLYTRVRYWRAMRAMRANTAYGKRLMSGEDWQAQREDWAYGNAHLSNPDVTPEMVRQVVIGGPEHMDARSAYPPDLIQKSQPSKECSLYPQPERTAPCRICGLPSPSESSDLCTKCWLKKA